MLRININSILNRVGVHLHRLRQSVISESDRVDLVSNEVIDRIFSFYKLVPPFYDDNIRPELRIEGAWGEDLRERRCGQITAIKDNNRAMYRYLLDNLFRSELLSGLWTVGYFNHNTIGSKADNEYEKILRFEIPRMYGSACPEWLCDGSFGKPWGIKIDEEHLATYLDIEYYGYAQNCAGLLTASHRETGKSSVFLDLGSGYGTLALKVAKMAEVPTTIYLLDIPLNLTTAYAYIKTNSSYDIDLVSTASELKHLAQSSAANTSTRFVCVPTIFAEYLSDLLPHISVLYNHGSFSEMQKDAIDFYINSFAGSSQCEYLYEINSNASFINNSDHVEVKSDDFNIPTCMSLIQRYPAIKRGRYVASLYKRTTL